MKKKICIIGGAVLLVLGIAAGVWQLFFPQLFSYFRIKKENPVINAHMTDYPYTNQTVPADFVSRTVRGITIKAPEACLNPKESKLVPFKGDALTVAVFIAEEKGDTFGGEDDPYGLTAAEYQHFFDTVGVKMPETQVENIVFLRDTLTAKTCLPLRGKDFEVFEALAEDKKTIANVETPYFYHGSNFDGLVCEIKNAKKKMYNALIEDTARQHSATVTVIAEDAELARQVIAGLDVTDFLAGKTL